MMRRALFGLALTVLAATSLDAQATPTWRDGIEPAVDRAVAAIVDRQRPDGSFVPPADAERRWASYLKRTPVGVSALSVYALLESGMSPQDEVIRRGVKYLVETETETTYGVAARVMALDATGDPQHRIMIRSAARWLEAKRLPHGLWGYPTGSGDLSNSQFAALALWFAERHGHRSRPATWTKAASTLIGWQNPDGGFRYDAKGATAKRRAGYSTGSTTVAALTILELARTRIGSVGDAETSARLNEVVLRGRRWLERRFTLTGNPTGPAGLLGARFDRRDKYTHLNYLYGFERLASLGHEDVWVERDWYGEGALFLLGHERDDGGWGSIVHDAFAVLFLGRAGRHAVEKARRFASDVAIDSSDETEAKTTTRDVARRGEAHVEASRDVIVDVTSASVSTSQSDQDRRLADGPDDDVPFISRWTVSPVLPAPTETGRVFVAGDTSFDPNEVPEIDETGALGWSLSSGARVRWSKPSSPASGGGRKLRPKVRVVGMPQVTAGVEAARWTGAAFTWLEASRATEALLWLQADAGVQVHLDGALVFHHPAEVPGHPGGHHVVSLALAPGLNRLLVTAFGTDRLGFGARLSGPDGGRPIDVLPRLDTDADDATQSALAHGDLYSLAELAEILPMGRPLRARRRDSNEFVDSVAIVGARAGSATFPLRAARRRDAFGRTRGVGRPLRFVRRLRVPVGSSDAVVEVRDRPTVRDGARGVVRVGVFNGADRTLHTRRLDDETYPHPWRIEVPMDAEAGREVLLVVEYVNDVVDADVRLLELTIRERR